MTRLKLMLQINTVCSRPKKKGAFMGFHLTTSQVRTWPEKQKWIAHPPPSQGADISLVFHSAVIP